MNIVEEYEKGWIISNESPIVKYLLPFWVEMKIYYICNGLIAQGVIFLFHSNSPPLYRSGVFLFYGKSSLFNL
jgi:hypothetical protein